MKRSSSYLLDEPSSKSHFLSNLYSDTYNLFTLPEDLSIRIFHLVKEHILCFRITSKSCLKLVDQYSFCKIYVLEHRLLKKMVIAADLGFEIDESTTEEHSSLSDEDRLTQEHQNSIYDDSFTEADNSETSLTEEPNDLTEVAWVFKMQGLKDLGQAYKLRHGNEKAIHCLGNFNHDQILYKIAKKEFLFDIKKRIYKKKEEFLTSFFCYKYKYLCNEVEFRNDLKAFLDVLEGCLNDEYYLADLWRWMIKKNPQLALRALKSIVLSNDPALHELRINFGSLCSLKPLFEVDRETSFQLAGADEEMEELFLHVLYQDMERQIEINLSEPVKDEIYNLLLRIVNFNSFCGTNLQWPDGFRFFNYAIRIITVLNTCQILVIIEQMTQCHNQNIFLASFTILAKLNQLEATHALIEKYRNSKSQEIAHTFIVELCEDIRILLTSLKEKNVLTDFNRMADFYSNATVKEIAPLKLFVNLLIFVIKPKEILKGIESCTQMTQIKIIEQLTENLYFSAKDELLNYMQSLIPKAEQFSLTELFQFLLVLGCLDVNSALNVIDSNPVKGPIHKKYKIDLLTSLIRSQNYRLEPSPNLLDAAQLLLNELDDDILLDNLGCYLEKKSSDVDGWLIKLNEILDDLIEGKCRDSAFRLLQKIENVLGRLNIPENTRATYLVKLVEDVRRLRKLTSY